MYETILHWSTLHLSITSFTLESKVSRCGELWPRMRLLIDLEKKGV
jgi:hypothetical protein